MPDGNEPGTRNREVEVLYNFIGVSDFEEIRKRTRATKKRRTGAV